MRIKKSLSVGVKALKDVFFIIKGWFSKISSSVLVGLRFFKEVIFKGFYRLVRWLKRVLFYIKGIVLGYFNRFKREIILFRDGIKKFCSVVVEGLTERLYNMFNFKNHWNSLKEKYKKGFTPEDYILLVCIFIVLIWLYIIWKVWF